MQKLSLYIFVSFFFFSAQVNAQYNYLWSKTFGSQQVEFATTISPTYDHEIIMAGDAQSKGPAAWIGKVTLDGQIKWFRIIDKYPILHIDKIISTDDSAYVAVGYNVLERSMGDGTLKQNIWLAKFDSLGRLIWDKTYTQFGNSRGLDIACTADGGYVIAASSAADQYDQKDWLILKTDSLGFYKWHNSFGSLFDEQPNSIAVLKNGTIVAGGYTAYNKGVYRYPTIAAFDNDGNQMWYFEKKIDNFAEITSLIGTSDTSVIATGFYKHKDRDDHDIIIFRFSAQGDSIWTKKIKMPFMEIPFSIIESYNQNFVLAYNMFQRTPMGGDVGILEFDENGKILYNRLYRRASDDYVAQLIEAADNTINLLVSTYIYNSGWKVGLLKMAPIEISDMIFISPSKKLSSVSQKEFNLKVCISGYKTPKQAVIYQNGKPVATIYDFQLTGDNKCPYYFETKVMLKYGYNKIKVVVTDYKDYIFDKKRTIIYLPVPSKRW